MAALHFGTPAELSGPKHCTCLFTGIAVVDAINYTCAFSKMSAVKRVFCNDIFLFEFFTAQDYKELCLWLTYSYCGCSITVGDHTGSK